MLQIPISAHFRIKKLSLAITAALLATAPFVSHAAEPTYSGRAVGVQAAVGVNGVIGVAKSIGDTGALPATGGQKSDKTSLNLNVGLLKISAKVDNLTTTGASKQATSAAELSNVGVDVAAALGLAAFSLQASAVKATTKAECDTTSTTLSANSSIVGLKINNGNVNVSGAPNQKITVLGGEVILNEQTKQANGATANAIHVRLPGLADVVISHAESGIVCPPQTAGKGETVLVAPTDPKEPPAKNSPRQPTLKPAVEPPKKQVHE